MKRWLIIIGYKGMGSSRCFDASICVNRIDNEGIFYSTTIDSGSDYNIILVSSESGLALSPELLTILGTRPEDEIVVFCHQSREGHPQGCNEDSLSVMVSKWKLKSRLFRGENPDEDNNYPFWVIKQICRAIIAGIAISSAPTWERLEGECNSNLYHRLIKSVVLNFLPLDVDMQALEILLGRNEEEAMAYLKKMRAYWTNERIEKRWKNVVKVADKIYDAEITSELSKYTSAHFIALIDSIGDVKRDGNNHFSSWFSNTVSDIKKQINK